MCKIRKYLSKVAHHAFSAEQLVFSHLSNVRAEVTDSLPLLAFAGLYVEDLNFIKLSCSIERETFFVSSLITC